MTTRNKSKTTARAVPAGQVDAVMAATRVLGGLIAESMASVETVVTMPQLRVLVLAGMEPQSVTTVAEDLGVHPSNATRTCDRLVRAGLLDRRAAEGDRRRVVLTLTEAGARLVDQVMAHRRERVEQIMGRMAAPDRAALAASLAAFVDEADHTHHGLQPAVRHA